MFVVHDSHPNHPNSCQFYSQQSRYHRCQVFHFRGILFLRLPNWSWKAYQLEYLKAYLSRHIYQGTKQRSRWCQWRCRTKRPCPAVASQAEAMLLHRHLAARKALTIHWHDNTWQDLRNMTWQHCPNMSKYDTDSVYTCIIMYIYHYIIVYLYNICFLHCFHFDPQWALLAQPSVQRLGQRRPDFHRNVCRQIMQLQWLPKPKECQDVFSIQICILCNIIYIYI